MARASRAARYGDAQLRWAERTAESLRAGGCDARLGVTLLARTWVPELVDVLRLGRSPQSELELESVASAAESVHASGMSEDLDSIAAIDAEFAAIARANSPGTTNAVELAAEVADGEWPGSRPDLLVLLYESMLSGERRRSGGVHYTPRRLAEFHADFVIDHLVGAHGLTWLGPGSIVDPACGSGAYLLAAARALLRHGADPVPVLASLSGWDIDADALDVCELVLMMMLASDKATEETVPLLRHGDFLARPDGVDSPWAVLGNPPFLGQLKRATSTAVDTARTRAVRLGLKIQPYSDVAALFLVDCVQWVRPGGVVSLLQPQSVLSARDAESARRAVAGIARPAYFWVDESPQFGAAVHVWCAPFVRSANSAPNSVDDDAGSSAADAVPVQTGIGDDAEDRGVVDWAALSTSPTWGGVVASARQVPPLDLGSTATLDGRVSATAGFRDEFYAVAAHTVEAPHTTSAPVRWRTITSGSVDPGVDRWGDRQTRLAGTVFVRPILDRDALRRSETPAAARVGRWVDRLSVPKVLVATQTRVIEACADLDGGAVPVTPVIAAIPVGIGVGQLLCALLSPAATVWAHRRTGGAGMSAGALRLRADDLAQVPVPIDADSWRAVGEWTESMIEALPGSGMGLSPATLRELARRMQAIQGFGDDVLQWWASRAPGLSESA